LHLYTSRIYKNKTRFKLGHPRFKSRWERRIAKELECKRVNYRYEKIRFSLPSGRTYKPDFILPDIKVDGRRIILEPHNPKYGFGHIMEFLEQYSNLYFLVIIIRNDDIPENRLILEILENKGWGTIWPFEYIDTLIDILRRDPNNLKGNNYNVKHQRTRIVDDFIKVANVKNTYVFI